TGIVHIVRGLRSQREHAEPLLPARLHHYLNDRIAITAWYPEVDYLALMEVLMRLSKGYTWERAGAFAAKEALSTVYRNVIVDGDLPETARRMPANWRNYHDTGDLTVENEPGLVRVKVENYCMESTVLCRLTQGYFAALLSFSGATITAQRKLKCTA